jgi:hypothetical protein
MAHSCDSENLPFGPSGRNRTIVAMLAVRISAEVRRGVSRLFGRQEFFPV